MNRLQEELQLEVKKATMVYLYGGKVNTALLLYAVRTRQLPEMAQAPNIVHSWVIPGEVRDNYTIS